MRTGGISTKFIFAITKLIEDIKCFKKIIYHLSMF